ncbi:MAG: SDR family NAD(P)-dependent oxidoreductase [Chloroflexota bacterium]
MIKRVMITGANSGVGKDSARQFALRDETEVVYIVARNPQRAEAARKDLVATTGRDIFEVVLMDTTDLNSARAAAMAIDEPIDALIMNAGGSGGATPGTRTDYGTTQIFAINVLGHVVLLEALLAMNKLTQVAVFASSEAARGMLGMPKPKLATSSVDDFAAVIDGSHWGTSYNGMQDYGLVKYVGSMWMASLARKYPNIRFVSISPGGTAGTEIGGTAPAGMRFIVNRILLPLGLFHSLDTGAKRYLDAVLDDRYQSGRFYASKRGATGEVVDQATIFPDLENAAYQDNAYEAIHRFIS